MQLNPWHGPVGFDYRDENWMSQAGCVGYEPEWWFWFEGTPPWIKQSAQKICAECPVATQCLEYSIETRSEFGVWAGMTENQRRKLLKGRKGNSDAA